MYLRKFYYYCCYYYYYYPPDHANEAIFHYLVEWDPIALKTRPSTSSHDNSLLSAILRCSTMSQDFGDRIFSNGEEDPSDEYFSVYSIETIKMVLKAGLKYFPNELGLLLHPKGDRFSLSCLMDHYYIRKVTGSYFLV